MVEIDDTAGENPTTPPPRDPVIGLLVFGLIGLVMICAGVWFIRGAWTEHADVAAVRDDGVTVPARVARTEGGSVATRPRGTHVRVVLPDGDTADVPSPHRYASGDRVQVKRSQRRPRAVRLVGYEQDRSLMWAIVGSIPLLLGAVTVAAVARSLTSR